VIGPRPAGGRQRRLPARPPGHLLAAACCAWLVLSGCRCGKPDQAVVPPPPPHAVANQPAVLATIPDQDLPPAEPLPAGLGLHLPVSGSELEFHFGEHGGGVAYAVEAPDGSRVVHNGRASKTYAAVGDIALSPDGRRCAHGALADGTWRMVVDGVEGQAFAAVRPAVFSPDGRHLAYQAMAGERWHLVVDATVNEGTPTRYLGFEFSADASRIAFIADADDQEQGRLVVSDLTFKAQAVVAPRASMLQASADRSGVAVIVASDGKQRVLTVAFDRPELARRGPAHDAVFSPAFGAAGLSVAYLAERAGQHLLVLDDREAPLPPGEPIGHPVIRPDGKAAAILLVSGGGVAPHQLFVTAGRGEEAHEACEGLVYGPGGSSLAYAARRGPRWFIVVDGQEGPSFDRVVSPAFSPDGKVLVYRARQDGKRFVVVADPRGRTIRQLPPYEQVFPVQFTADGRSIGYGVKDGRQLAWKVEPL
jgi:hypothetical protein